MLKVTLLGAQTQPRLVVEGTLAGPWVAELESAWLKACALGGEEPIRVDLSETTVIDARGRALLLQMAAAGSELVATGVYTGYMVRRLVEKQRESSCRIGAGSNDIEE